MEMLEGIGGEMALPALVGMIALLALVDSTSLGTLAVPVWLLMAPGRVRVGRLLLYLASIAGFYAAVGLILLVAADAILGAVNGVRSSPTGTTVQLLVGAGLVALSFTLDTKKKREEAAAGGSGRLRRWRDRVTGPQRGSGAALAVLAVTMGLAELATLLPYLAAIGLVGTSGIGWPASGGLIVFYCLVMITPALVLTGLRVVAARWVERPVRRLDAWITRNSASTTGWIVGIVGFVVAMDALGNF